MSRPNHSEAMPDRERLETLFSKMCDDQLTAAELEELDGELARSPEARVYYRRYMNLHAAMFTYLGQEDGVAQEVGAAVTGEAEQNVRTQPYLVPRIPPARVTPIQAQPRPKRAGFELYRIGDAVSSRSIHAAMLDAYRLCRRF